jgi:hypothetical protein
MKKDYQDIFMKLSEKSKKKGGSLAAVFKLIQELADFEEKIEECANAQEMSQNREKINGFISDLDRMYEMLFDMAKGGIQSIRASRGKIEDEEGMVVEEEAGVVEKEPVAMNVPKVPRM